MEFTVEEVVSIVKGSFCLKPLEPWLLTSIAWDSREVAAGGLFVALPGARVDGHEFIESAIASGAMSFLASAG